jgi:hypothetical protein
MADQWLFKSETYDNCNCAMNCGCQFNLPTTHGYCQSAFVGNVVEGHFNDTRLAGLNWAALYKWPGEIKDGNGRRQIVIDERADEAQRIGLESIISGEACEPFSNLFAVFASTCSEFCETLFLPIDLEADLELRTASVDTRSHAEQRPADGQRVHRRTVPHCSGASQWQFRVHLRGNRPRHHVGHWRHGNDVQRFMGPFLRSPLQSRWLGSRTIEAHGMA